MEPAAETLADLFLRANAVRHLVIPVGIRSHRR
jgi:hypothetical protein